MDFNYTYAGTPPISFVTIAELLHNGWTYNPSTQGAITGIDFSVDKLLNVPAGFGISEPRRDSNQQVFPAIYGRNYFGQPRLRYSLGC